MIRRFFHRFSMIVLIAALSVGLILPVSADSGTADASQEQIADSSPIGSVDIGRNSYIQLKNVSILPGEEGDTVTFTLSLFNGSATEIQFIDYWVRLQSKSGIQYTVSVLPQDKDKNNVPPQTSQDFHFYAKVSTGTSLSDLIFKVIKWDFLVDGFEREIGQIAVPEDYSVDTPPGMKRIVSIANNPFKTNIDRVVISKNDTYYLPAIYFVMENVGNRTVKLPDLQFSIRTINGLIYPLQVSGLGKDTSIQPMVKKEGTLTGSIPVSVSPEGWQLVVTQTANVDNTTVSLPIAFYELPQASEEEVSLGNDYEFSNKAGVYTVRLNSLHRLPWEDQDILTANLSLANKGSQSLPIPDLAGYFKLDDSVKVDAKVIRTDNVIGLPTGEEITIHILGKIPYTYQFSSIKLYLQEKESTGSGPSATSNFVDLIQFNHNSDLMNIPSVGEGEKFKLNDIGRASAYSVRSVHTFSGSTADIFSVQMEVENLEKRFTNVRKLVAHFKTPDGTVFPANVAEIDGKVSPGGKALLHLWSTVPKGFASTGMQVLIGDAIKDGKLADKDPDSYVGAVAFALPAEDFSVKSELKNIEIFPYTLSLSKIAGQLVNFNAGTFKVTFDYELNKDLMVKTNTKDHKLIIELEDTKGNFKTSKVYDLESGQEEASTLKLGTNKGEFTHTDKDLVYKLQDLKTYKLNVYHQFQTGQKKLIASKELTWFAVSD